jgi:hypothetical protein
MIKALRTRHRQIWTVMAIVAPMAIILTWLVIPNPVPVTLLQAESYSPLPVVVASSIQKNREIFLRSSPNKTSWQLEWRNITPLTVPSALIYRVVGQSKRIEDNELIGRIEARGGYAFPLRNKEGAIPKFIVYDFIHEKIIEEIELK